MILNNTQVQRTRAFTLIEIMIAIAVIAILVGILFIAGRGVFSSSAGKATQVNLSALKGMFGEFDAKTRLGSSPPDWTWFVNSVQTLTPASPGNPDFWRIPNVYNGNPDAMDAPGPVVVDTGDTRNASRQILNTQLVMNYILAMPNNRKALEQFHPDQYMVPEWRAQTTNLPSPNSTDRVLYTTGSSTENPIYVIGTRVQYNGQRFIKISTSQSTPMAGSDWQLDNGPAYPILLDGWGNPIIFVPGSGLRVRLLNGEKDYTGTNVITAIIISPEGKVDSTTTPGQPKVLVPGRPFWASAGPDGDFAKGDDNIYSFNQ